MNEMATAFSFRSGHSRYALTMSRQPSTGVLIAVITFVVIAAVVRFYSAPLYSALLRMHGR
jgi:hypothetical protein